MRHVLGAAFVSFVLIGSPAATAQNKPALQWEGMQKVRLDRFDEGWLAPGVNFRTYTKVMIDPVEASFRRNWLRDYNKVNFDLESRLSDEDAQKILTEAQSGLGDAFTQAAQSAGYQVVSAPGPDVLQVKPYLIDLDVHAPDPMRSARSRTFAEEAGSGRLVLEVRDSVSGALLAGGVDKRIIGNMDFPQRRSSVTNRADFSRAFRNWADASTEALTGLTTTTPQPARF